jgi:cytochrome P450
MQSDLGTKDLPTIDFDPFSETFFNDPTEIYRRLRDEMPVYHNSHYGFWALSRWDDVTESHKQWQALSSTYGTSLSFLLTHQVSTFESIIMMDPPKHDRLRKLVSRVFTPRSIGALEPMIREVITSTLEELEGRTDFDAVAEFTAPFPVEIISRMLGVPPKDRQQVRLRLDAILHREAGQVDETPAGREAMEASGIYFYNLVQEKRAHPGDDMLSELTRVEVDRGDGEMTGLTDVEIAGFAGLLGGAGAETVTKLLGNAVVLFARHPDQWDKVLADSGKIPGAVEEILRYYPPSQYQGRYTMDDMTVHDVTIPKGSPVLLLTGSATRDPRHFDHPDRFDVERPPGLALGFGYGIHSCLGAALARVESRIAIEELARRYPRYEIDEGGLRRVHMANVAGYKNVPVHIPT